MITFYILEDHWQSEQQEAQLPHHVRQAVLAGFSGKPRRACLSLDGGVIGKPLFALDAKGRVVIDAWIEGSEPTMSVKGTLLRITVIGQCPTCFAINRHEPNCAGTGSKKRGAIMSGYMPPEVSPRDIPGNDVDETCEVCKLQASECSCPASRYDEPLYYAATVDESRPAHVALARHDENGLCDGITYLHVGEARELIAQLQAAIDIITQETP